jgi:hypothetical protein
MCLMSRGGLRPRHKGGPNMVAVEEAKVAVPTEREHFKRLFAENPNYFGNLVGSPYRG